MDIVLIAHNLRSTHNVGSLLRTADGLGVGKVYLTGYSPYPLRETARETDSRLPHLAAKTANQIAKTALGAEKLPFWEHQEDIFAVLEVLRRDGYKIAALEQAATSISLSNFKVSGKIALIVGREVEGIETEIQKAADYILEIPMHGQKESFNVAVAAAIALYHLQSDT